LRCRLPIALRTWPEALAIVSPDFAGRCAAAKVTIRWHGFGAIAA
jgi:hypothetical protein